MKSQINQTFSKLLNVILLLLVVMVALAIATIALTKKVNDNYNKYNQAINATVVKQTIPVLSLQQGIVTKVYVKTGDTVKKGDILMKTSNPLLSSEISILQQYQNNVSAQTQADIAKAQLGSLNIYAPTNGIVGDINITEGSSINDFTPVLTIYASNDIRLLTELTEDEYQNLQSKQQIFAYSKRLNQTFQVVPSILKPDEKTPLNFQEKKIGVYLTFKNNQDGVSLLNNEDVNLQLDQQSEKTKKPIDFFVDFWNSLLSRPPTSK